MRRALWLLAGAAAAGVLVLGQNLFGRQVNALFLLLPGIDKVLHFIEYCALFVVLDRLASSTIVSARRRVLAVAGFGLLLSLVDEGVQQFAPGRNVEVLDLVADWSGLTFGWLIVARPRRLVMVAAGTVAAVAAVSATATTHVRLRDYSRALAYERQHDFARAREYYLKALGSGMQTAELFNGLSWVSAESGVADPKEAVAYGRAALDRQPGNPDILDTYGWALHRAGRSREALPYLEQAYEKKPDMYCIHYHLGDAYRALGRSDLAVIHFRRQRELTGTREA